MLDKTFPHLFVYSTMCTFPLLFLITVNCSETFHSTDCRTSTITRNKSIYLAIKILITPRVHITTLIRRTYNNGTKCNERNRILYFTIFMDQRNTCNFF